jgi:hypothetical protein
MIRKDLKHIQLNQQQERQKTKPNENVANNKAVSYS